MSIKSLNGYGAELDEDDSPKLTKGKLRALEEGGRSGWDAIRDLREKDEEKRDMLKALKDFQNKTE
jgi:hypothetical protein